MTCEKCQTPLSDTERHMLMDSGPDVRVLCDTCRRDAIQVEVQKLQQKMEGGVKFDGGKLRMDLLPPDTLESLADILTLGADKYQERNWEQGMDWGRVYGATLRHLFRFWQGEDLDPESGKPHIHHALCNVTFLATYFNRKLGKDSRLFVGGCR
jgi:hypothetical protein